MCVTISDMPRRVVIVAYDGVQMLDAVGPLDVFAAANAIHRAAGNANGTGGAADVYRVEVVGPGSRAESTSGQPLVTRPIAGVRGPLDTLLVAGGLGSARAAEDVELVGHIARLARRSRRRTSVCSGALVLAAAGVLDGHRVTTHWSVAGMLARLHPAVEVDADPIYIEDGDVWTSAGVTAGIDLALAMVAADIDVQVANDVARWFVLPARRPGFQSQYSPRLARSTTEHEGEDGFVALLAWMAEHLADDLSVAELAAHVHLGERQFARRFKDAVGTTPAEYVESLRLDRARALLESGSLDVSSIARQCGFRNRETLHRTFVRRLGVTPAAHRSAFGAGQAARRIA